MNYQSIYDQLIAKYKDHPQIKFQTNNHHIIPKSFAKVDGIEDIDGRWNRVHLPHREHFIAHLLLARIWRDHPIKGPKMAKPFTLMRTDEKYTSKDYAWLKLNYAVSEDAKIKMSKARKGKSKSEETKQKMRKPKSEETKQKMRKPKSKEHCKNIGKGQLGRVQTEETKQKIREKKIGRMLSPEHKAKIAQSMTGKKRKPYGPHSSETKNKISNGLKRHYDGPHGNETIEKIKMTKSS